jgi:predicted DNA-binding protein
MSLQVSIRLNGWHKQQLLSLTKEAQRSHTTIARELLMAALEQTSDNPPEQVGSTHLVKFHNGRKS